MPDAATHMTSSRILDRLRTIDAARESAQVAEWVQRTIHTDFHRRGAVVAVSGGIDSATCLFLCARAMGPSRVLALFLPGRNTAPESESLARSVAVAAGVELLVQPIAPILEPLGVYRLQEEAVRSAVSGFGPGWRFKVVLPSILEAERMNLPRIVASSPEGKEHSSRLSSEAYLQLIAATNFKQRVRTMIAYYHADRLNHAVCGTPNRLEYDQGFFVKGGDGLADFKPIAHLYKTQVYALARELGVPDEVMHRIPTTDTFSLTQTQEEFYFSVPLEAMDVCLYGLNMGLSPDTVAAEAGLSVEQLARIWYDIRAKRRATAGMHRTGLVVEPIEL